MCICPYPVDDDGGAKVSTPLEPEPPRYPEGLAHNLGLQYVHLHSGVRISDVPVSS